MIHSIVVPCSCFGHGSACICTYVGRKESLSALILNWQVMAPWCQLTVLRMMCATVLTFSTTGVIEALKPQIDAEWRHFGTFLFVELTLVNSIERDNSKSISLTPSGWPTVTLWESINRVEIACSLPWHSIDWHSDDQHSQQCGCVSIPNWWLCYCVLEGSCMSLPHCAPCTFIAAITTLLTTLSIGVVFCVFYHLHCFAF